MAHGPPGPRCSAPMRFYRLGYFQWDTNRKLHVANRTVTWSMTSRDLERSRSWPQYVCGPLSRKWLEIGLHAQLWLHVTLKVKVILVYLDRLTWRRVLGPCQTRDKVGQLYRATLLRDKVASGNCQFSTGKQSPNKHGPWATRDVRQATLSRNFVARQSCAILSRVWHGP